MARQISFRLFDDGAWAGGWSDLFNRFIGESASRLAGTRSAPFVIRMVPNENVAQGPLAAGFPLMAESGRFVLTFPALPFDILLPGGGTNPAPSDIIVPAPADVAALSPLNNAGQTGVGGATMFSPGQNGVGRDDAPGVFAAGSQGYQVLYTEDLGLGLIIDLAKREIVPDGTRYIDLGGSEGDVLVIAGALPAASGLPVGLVGLEGVALRPGASYELTSEDYHLAPGDVLTINGMELGPDETIAFDGSAETDGHFDFFGGGGADRFRGGGGGDRISGMGGADELGGGGGSDIFAYSDAGESSGAAYDSLFDFDPGADLIDLPVEVTGFDAAIVHGGLSEATFDDDLAAALGGLGAGQAVFFAPDSGGLAGTIFLIVDGNGEEGYQAGEDYVFALTGGNIDVFATTDFFV